MASRAVSPLPDLASPCLENASIAAWRLEQPAFNRRRLNAENLIAF
jgi:hypothetical protein